jgi:hypothetical protein
MKFKVIIEYADGRPSRQGRPVYPDILTSGMPELLFELATNKELSALYVVPERPLKIPEKKS